jgi:NTE family protein
LHKNKRPKIGLVLSGGGAGFWGFKVLEGVKITLAWFFHMGAVIGGLYASGYTATQIDSIFQATEHNGLVNDFMNGKNFYERRNNELCERR